VLTHLRFGQLQSGVCQGRHLQAQVHRRLLQEQLCGGLQLQRRLCGKRRRVRVAMRRGRQLPDELPEQRLQDREAQEEARRQEEVAAAAQARQRGLPQIPAVPADSVPPLLPPVATVDAPPADLPPAPVPDPPDPLPALLPARGSLYHGLYPA
jgi:hypothetical protein